MKYIGEGWLIKKRYTYIYRELLNSTWNPCVEVFVVQTNL